MTIRLVILRAFLALVLLAILLSGSLSYIELRQALRKDIAQNLGNEAQTLQERVNVYLIERMEDIREWDRLELMQDIRIGDIDKRLARLLSDLKAGHGEVYTSLFCTDTGNHIVAASEPALIGKTRLPGIPIRRQNDSVNNGVSLERSPSSSPEGPDHIVLRMPVPDAFGPGSLGYLYAVLNWQVVQGFLDSSVADSERTALLLDEQDRIVSAAGPLAPPARAIAMTLPHWDLQTGHASIQSHSGSPLGVGEVLVGTASGSGYFRDNNWHMLVVVPTQIAYAPITHLSWGLFGGLLLSLALAGWLAVRLSGRIAQPIREVTVFARNFRKAGASSLPQVETNIREASELGRAIGEMIQALEKSQEQLVRASKLAVVGEMAATMAHEVRTPLGILKSSAQMLQRRPDLSDQDRELTGFIVSETERLNKLITTLLESTSPRPPHFMNHDLHAIIAHVLGLIEGKLESGNLSLEQILQADPGEIVCDREQIIQVLLNILINAIQHVPDGGHIRLSTENLSVGMRVRIDDDGPGIPEADRARVFDPFFTQRKGGFGLGLSIVQQIVLAHGGHIAVTKSTLGGACFTIDFPESLPTEDMKGNPRD